MHPLLRRNRSRWTPRELRPIAWFDSSDVGSLDIQSGTVNRWLDRSGNGNHATVVGTAPAYDLRGFNGRLPAVKFNGTSDFMSHPCTVTAQPFAAIFVGHGMNAASGAGLLYVGGYDLQMSVTAANWNIWADAGGIYTGSGDTGEALFIGHWNSAGTSTVSINGTRYTSGASLGPGGLAATMYIGGKDFANYAAANVAEIIVVPRLLTEQDMLWLEGYCAGKWGFSAKLPQSHPFRNARP